MGWTFRMVFEGVCAFVPDTALYEKSGSTFKPAPQPPKKMTVLLPDLQQAAEVDLKPPQIRAAHFPLMIFKNEDLSPASDRFIDLNVRASTDDCDKGVLVLKGDSIEFEIDGPEWESTQAGNSSTGSHWLKVTTDSSNRPLPSTADQRSLWWLPRLEEIAPGSPRLDRKYLPVAGQALHEEIVAALTFRSGHLQTLGFNATSSTTAEPAVWTFSDPHRPNLAGTWNRAVGNRIALEFNDLTKPFGLKLTRFVEGHPIESKAFFSPPSGSRRGMVEVVLANVEPEKLFEEHGLFRTPTVGRHDPDFNIFYQLLGLDTGPLPTRQGGMTAFGPDTKPCAPTLLNGT